MGMVTGTVTDTHMAKKTKRDLISGGDTSGRNLKYIFNIYPAIAGCIIFTI